MKETLRPLTPEEAHARLAPLFEGIPPESPYQIPEERPDLAEDPWGRLWRPSRKPHDASHTAFLLTTLANLAGPHPHPRAYLAPQEVEVLYPPKSLKETLAALRSFQTQDLAHPLLFAPQVAAARVRVVLQAKGPPLIMLGGLRRTTPCLDPVALAWTVEPEDIPMRVLGWTPEAAARLLGAGLAYVSGGELSIVVEGEDERPDLTRAFLDEEERARRVADLSINRFFSSTGITRLNLTPARLRELREAFEELLAEPEPWLPRMAARFLEVGDLASNWAPWQASYIPRDPVVEALLPEAHPELREWAARYAASAAACWLMTERRSPGHRAPVPLAEPVHPLHPAVDLDAPAVTDPDSELPAALRRLAGAD